MTRSGDHIATRPSFQLSEDNSVLTVRIPMTFKDRGARKLVVTPAGTTWCPPPPMRTTNALIMAIARAHRWKNMMESGDYASTAELANAEGINFSYLCRVLRLTLLSPTLVEAILNGTKASLELKNLMKPLSVVWSEQENALG